MRTIFIYNPQSKNEMSMLAEIRNEMPNIEIFDFNVIRDVFQIRTTPALIFIKDSLQGEQLLDVDPQKNKTRVMLEFLKEQENEDLILHNQKTRRIDFFVENEVAKRLAKITEVVI